MNTYFYKVKSPFSEEEISQLEDMAKSHENDFFDCLTHKGYKDGNRVYIPEQTIIKKYLEKFPSECWGGWLWHKAGTEVIKHRDNIVNKQNPNKRLSVFVQPLFDSCKNHPCYFWESKESTEPVAICDYDDACIINTQEFHSVPNITTDRIQFQVSFPLDINESIKYLEIRD